MARKPKKKTGKKAKRLEIEPPSGDRGHPLYLMLEIAVPLWIDKMSGMSDEDAMSRVAECSERIQDAGEYVLFRGKQKGKTADGFNAVAEALAILARCPGGVRFGPHHWDAKQDFPYLVSYKSPAVSP